MISYDDVTSARARIEKYIYKTPLEYSMAFSGKAEVYLKLECQQRQKSFKVRGAFSKLTNVPKNLLGNGVSAISSGNHAAAVSYACHMLGIGKCLVYVPETTPQSKIKKIEFYGGTVVKAGQNYDEAREYGLSKTGGDKSVYVDSCSDPEVIAGQGTVGLEILDQCPYIDEILAPIGGGGLITGIAVAAKHRNPHIMITGVQTKACPAMVKSLEDGVLYETFPSEESVCDALIGGVAEIPFKMAGRCIDRIITVSEDAIKKSCAMLLGIDKVVAEPAGAAAVAAVLENESMFAGKKVAAVVSGGNLDAGLMKKLAEKYL